MSIRFISCAFALLASLVTGCASAPQTTPAPSNTPEATTSPNPVLPSVTRSPAAPAQTASPAQQQQPSPTPAALAPAVSDSLTVEKAFEDLAALGNEQTIQTTWLSLRLADPGKSDAVLVYAMSLAEQPHDSKHADGKAVTAYLLKLFSVQDRAKFAQMRMQAMIDNNVADALLRNATLNAMLSRLATAQPTAIEEIPGFSLPSAAPAPAPNRAPSGNTGGAPTAMLASAPSLEQQVLARRILRGESLEEEAVRADIAQLRANGRIASSSASRYENETAVQYGLGRATVARANLSNYDYSRNIHWRDKASSLGHLRDSVSTLGFLANTVRVASGRQAWNFPQGGYERGGSITLGQQQWGNFQGWGGYGVGHQGGSRARFLQQQNGNATGRGYGSGGGTDQNGLTGRQRFLQQQNGNRRW